MSKTITEEGVVIKSYGSSITKKLPVFYNPAMKINRDISLLVIASYFDKKIKFCDPMAASGIRELRFLKAIPQKFSKIVIGDVSRTATKNILDNFELNGVPFFDDIVDLTEGHAINTISSSYFDFIEIDPFGTPVPFLDIAIQRIKHNGILSVTATDTAALCGTYPKKTLRRYAIKVQKTLWHEELGLRNLIAYCITQSAKYDKALTPIISFTNSHFYKIFFKVEESRSKAYKNVKDLSWIECDNKTQQVSIKQLETKNSMGKTYVGKLNNKQFISKMQNNLELIKENKQSEQLLSKLKKELDILGYINPHKLAKANKMSFETKFEELFEKIKKKKHKVSRVHNNNLGIKTTMKSKELVKLINN